MTNPQPSDPARLPWVEIDAVHPDLALMEASAPVLGAYQALALQRSAWGLLVAVAAPVASPESLQQRLSAAVGEPVACLQVTARDWQELQASAAGRSLPAPDHGPTGEADDSPVRQWVDRLFRQAISEGASDIHLEPGEAGWRLRLRRDGLLYPATPPDRALCEGVVSRIKILANMNIAERRRPQDGRSTIAVSDRHRVDVRVSSCPTVFGEKLVLRLLDRQRALLDLDHIGLEPEQYRLMLTALQRPSGLILVTGPTGSGKTVSLYAALRHLNDNTRNISSVEDPVELHLDGINQVALNRRAGLDFPEVLRALLRQDPDVIMVGEIRDPETATIAVRAAQTGHLVLSTLHTNGACDAITRLVNLGVARHNLASCLTLVVAQRLLRRLCRACSLPSPAGGERLSLTGIRDDGHDGHRLRTAVGCDVCASGYRGRIGVHELLAVSDRIRAGIIEGVSEDALRTLARQQSPLDLREAGLRKARRGDTGIDEVLRVMG